MGRNLGPDPYYFVLGRALGSSFWTVLVLVRKAQLIFLALILRIQLGSVHCLLSPCIVCYNSHLCINLYLLCLICKR
jgi:hypothetical protein